MEQNLWQKRIIALLVKKLSVLWNRKVRCHVQKNPPLDPIPNNVHEVHKWRLISVWSTLILSSHLCLNVSQLVHFLRFRLVFTCILPWNKFIYDTKRRNIGVVMVVTEFIGIYPIKYIPDIQKCILAARLWYFRFVCMCVVYNNDVSCTKHMLTHLQNVVEIRLWK
jgi:hypothetical protein